ncbi:MAG: ThiF domain-containing protein [Candidatus Wolfebacteria bacterium GW2011_GWE1_48_7]|uniref:ThiF domain-containing protein n=2 Tax=Candidatus Wolfeibacteriota TaxID=1752735 RepID=A0A0G1WGX1_9BACT|nr:MAG: ThiF domain-containing protein [Candidatus Wolfebacteria bacterium GW2011_GWC2_46_275]KKU41759.1 MAG: ThiF domain-containing protein [Candidatus Wolfebacteria bacterium GW2011_GWB2_46_69]KKU53947.1 MAG: ThiF domain-containing protein [Candidatus Wolfebacteria bacterium GW2011_GWC1_47_103]KKU65525.1 MAG: ThiF domain-containing protein [Candidatus Wolfebacteria bacterium GW2011_GWD2_47_17]KKU72111.1 MAG: ThiF domain-containing protein [Candidatus Wolfebacteria bacterium GW2011_GWB1_47_243
MDTKIKPMQWNKATESLEDFKAKLEIREIIDAYDALLDELFQVRNPKYKFIPEHKEDCAEFKEEYLAGKSTQEDGEWFYFPYSKNLIHYLPDAVHQELRTARNKNLITKEEQEKFYNYTVAIAGLSVGSHPALAIATMGGAKKIKIADADEVSGPNLNRLRYDCSTLGKNKAHLVANHILQLNPYGEVEMYDMGVTPENIDAFLEGADVVIEEVDFLPMKIMLREAAKKKGLPLIMATDNGDGVIVDVERYDLDPNTQLFNGAAGDVSMDTLKAMSPADLPKLATQIAGPYMVVPRMQQSILEVGKTLYSWPQLGDAAIMCGPVIAYLVKRLAIGGKVASGKFDVSLDAILDPDYHTEEARAKREADIREVHKAIGFIE